MHDKHLRYANIGGMCKTLPWCCFNWTDFGNCIIVQIY